MVCNRLRDDERARENRQARPKLGDYGQDQIKVHHLFLFAVTTSGCLGSQRLTRVQEVPIISAEETKLIQNSIKNDACNGCWKRLKPYQACNENEFFFCLQVLMCKTKRQATTKPREESCTTLLPVAAIDLALHSSAERI